jgi:signal transduction histidine kinase
MLRDAMPERVRVDLSMPPDLPKIDIDSTEFELALLNLAINAKDAMPNRGEINVSAFTKWDRDGKHGPGVCYLVVEVADTGAGIPAHELPRVFEPFFTTKEIGKGTGLGLSQVHGFAHQSGGKVEIDSTVGHGTRVRLFLPANDPEIEPLAGSLRGGH